MEEIEVNVERTLTGPTGTAHIWVTHEWGREDKYVAVSNAYDWTPDSIGVYKLKYLDSALAVLKTEFVSAFVPIIDKDSFITDYPRYQSLTDSEYSSIERITRHIIQNYTGQRFGPYVDQTIEVPGDGGDSLQLPAPVSSLVSVATTYGEDLTDIVEVPFGEPTFLQRTNKFNGRSADTKADIFFEHSNTFNTEQTFLVTGNFGWEYVPVGVSTAAGILMSGAFGGGDIEKMRESGIFAAQIGDFSMKMNADQWGTTGNAKVDNMLGEYVNFGIGLV